MDLFGSLTIQKCQLIYRTTFETVCDMRTITIRQEKTKQTTRTHCDGEIVGGRLIVGSFQPRRARCS